MIFWNSFQLEVLLNSSSTSRLSSVVNNKLKTLGLKIFTIPRNSLIAVSSRVKKICPLCHGSRIIGKYEWFLRLPVSERLKKIQFQCMCTNCLSVTHSSSKFSSKYTCCLCLARHHSLLHLGKKEQKPLASETLIFLPTAKAASLSESSTKQNSHVFVGSVNSSSLNVLRTTLIRIRDKYGHWIPVRALILGCKDQR